MSVRFYWNKRAFLNAVRDTSRDALNDVQEPAHAQWLQIAPVGADRAAPRRFIALVGKKLTPEQAGAEHKAGQLRDSWRSWLKVTQRTVYLYFGAFTRYAIFVELGTGKMAPRAPIRKTAEVIAPLLLPALIRQAARRGLRVR